MVVPLIFMGCGVVDDVKDGTLNFNKGITIGEAFDTWDDCSKSEWNSFEGTNDKTVVEFHCTKENVDDFFRKFIEISEGRAEFKNRNRVEEVFGVQDVVQTFQFLVTPKGVIRIGNVSTKMTWKDGLVSESSQNSTLEIGKAYNNVVTYNVADVSYPSLIMVGGSMMLLREKLKKD